MVRLNQSQAFAKRSMLPCMSDWGWHWTLSHQRTRSHGLYLHARSSWPAISECWNATADTVPDSNINVSIAKSVRQHCEKHHEEKSGNQHAVLLYSVGDGKRLGLLTVVLYSEIYVDVELLEQSWQTRRASKLGRDVPQHPPAADRIKCLCHIHEVGVWSNVLLPILLLKFVSFEDHVHAAASYVESTLGVGCVPDVHWGDWTGRGPESSQQRRARKCLGGNLGVLVPFSFVEVDDYCVHDFLEQPFLDQHKGYM